MDELSRLPCTALRWTGRGTFGGSAAPGSTNIRVRSRAPLRLGLAGGGTDVSPYPEQFGGAVLNATICRYAFALIEASLDSKVHFAASDLGIEESLPLDLEAIAVAGLKLHAAVYRRMVTEFAGGRPMAVRVTTSVDAPAGSGLGSSSSLIVALVEAFAAVLDVHLGPYGVARLAYEIERVELNLAGGKQDHYAAAFGGMNFIEFMVNGRVIVNPLQISRSAIQELEASLITCFVGTSRSSEQIIGEQQRHMLRRSKRTLRSMHQMKAHAVEMKSALLRGQIEEMAEVLGRSWTSKKASAKGISTPEIEKFHAAALAAGALAGKVSGAGGGGFMMFVAPPERRYQVISALNRVGGKAEGVHFTSHGAECWIPPSRR